MLEPGSPVVIGVMPGLRPAVVECASEIAELLGGGQDLRRLRRRGVVLAVRGAPGGGGPGLLRGGDGGFPAELRSEIESLLGPAGQPRQPCGSSPSRDSRGQRLRRDRFGTGARASAQTGACFDENAARNAREKTMLSDTPSLRRGRRASAFRIEVSGRIRPADS